MGGKASRTKGQVGEREVCKLLGEALGVSLDRNLDQVRNGGCDIVYEHFAIEVKRQEKLQIDKWWEQCVRQAKAIEKHPILVFRRNRESWRVLMPLSLEQDPATHYVHTDLDYMIQRIKFT